MCFDIAVRKRIGELDLDIALRSDARLTAIVGPSGCGKTSLLNMVAGLIRPDQGRVIVAGETLFDSDEATDLAPDRRRVGYVFQDRRLFPHMRVQGNLMFGANRRTRPADTPLTLDKVADLLGIAHLLDRWPSSLSGGEAQRVAIGRVLLSGPRFLLMDEPLGALDAARRGEIMTLIERIRDTLAIPILYVSHDNNEVERLSGNIITL
jgi:molybdate transport system ATP-binding protein